MGKQVEIGELVSILGDANTVTVWKIDYRKNEVKSVIGSEEPLYEEVKSQIIKKKIQEYVYKDNKYYIFQFKYGISYVFRVEADVQFDKNQLELVYHFIFPYYLRELEKRNEETLTRLLTGIKISNQVVDRLELYNQIVQNLYTVIDKIKSISYWKYDINKERFECMVNKGSVVYPTSTIEYKKEKIHLLKSKGNFISSLDINDFRNLQKNSEQLYMYAFFIDEILDKALDGILIFELNENIPKLLEEEIQLFSSFSEQINVILKNLNQYEKLKKLNEALLKRDEIHGNLSRLLLKNKGLDLIIVELSKMIGRDLVLIDFINNKILTSKRELSKNIFYSELLDIIMNNHEEIVIPLLINGQLKFILYPIYREETLMSCILVETNKELSQTEFLILEQGKLIILLEMLKEQQLSNFYTNKKREKFLELIEASDLIKQKELLEYLDLETVDTYRMVIINFASYTSIIELDIIIHQFMTNVKRDFYHNISLVFANQEEIIILFKLLNKEDYALFLRFFNTKMKSKEFRDIKLKIGISNEYNNIFLIRKPYFESKLVVKFLNNKVDSTIMNYKELGILGLFVHQSKDVIENFLKEILGELLLEKNAMLEETLVTYLNNNCNANDAAKKLHIHINTFYYRLKKIEDILNLTLQSKEDMLKVQLAYFLRENFIT